MGKRKKTRREKKIADNRHTLHHLETTINQELKPIEKKTTPDVEISIPATRSKATVISYDYVMADVRKITLMSIILILAQFALFIFWQRV